MKNAGSVVALGAVLIFGQGCALEVAPPMVVAPPTMNLSDAPFDPTGTIRVTVPPPVDVTRAAACSALVEGAPDPSLIDALGKTLDKSEAAELVAVDVVASTDGASFLVTPRAPLLPSTGYTFVLGACLPLGDQALGRPLVRAFVTDTLDHAAPVVTLVAPAVDAPDVVRNLAAVDFAISRPVAPLDVALIGDDGVAVPAHLDDSAPCSGCTRLDLDGVLVAGRRYVVQLAPDAVASDGRSAFGAPPGFTVGSALRTDPIALGAVRIEGVDRCAVARFTTTEAATSTLCLGSDCADTSGLGSQLLGLTLSDGIATVTLVAGDESTRPRASVSATVSLADVPLVMSEVLTEPLGSHYAQQFVELHSRSSSEVSLAGLTLVTAEGRNVLPATVVAPGGYALVVTHSFVADDGQDATPAAGTPLARVSEGTLGGHGLRIGEPVWIEDSAGHIVTRWSAFTVTVAHGQSVVRVADDACDLPASFVANPTGSATPGGGENASP